MNEKEAIDGTVDSFEFSKSLRDVVLMLVLVGFGVWSFIEFSSGRYGDIAALTAAFLLVGGISYLVKTPMKARRAGTIIALVGSFAGFYVCYSATISIMEGGYFPFPYEVGLLSILVSFLCVVISFSQFCKSM